MQSRQFSIEPHVSIVVVVEVDVVVVEVVLVVVDVVDVVEVLVVEVDVVEVVLVDVVEVLVVLVDVVEVVLVVVVTVEVVQGAAVMLDSPYHSVSMMMAISLLMSPVLRTVIMEVSLTAFLPAEQRVSLMLIVLPLI